jgi:hypothetical protein
MERDHPILALLESIKHMPGAYSQIVIGAAATDAVAHIRELEDENKRLRDDLDWFIRQNDRLWSFVEWVAKKNPDHDNTVGRAARDLMDRIEAGKKGGE